MSTILIVSSEKYSGKSSLAVGLALELRERGFDVGYMKPIGAYPIKVDQKKVDEDAYFIAEALSLEEELADVTQFFLTWDNMTRFMRKMPARPREKVKAAYDRLARGRDIMIVEGAENFIHGRMLGLSSFELAEVLGGSVLFLDTYNDELTVDRIMGARDFFGEVFLGAVLNWVPERRGEYVKNLLARFMASQGIKMFGSLSTDRVLRSITVDDLAAGLNGRIICAQDRGDELIESMMVGAMGQEQALRLFRKQANKVVITGGDRSDVQMAALETPTKSLILTGGHRPSPLVLGQAEEMGVPIIMVDHDTATTVEMVESAIGHQKVHSPKKIERMRAHIRDELDLEALLEEVGRRDAG
ncbi:MAG: phosphotransacetylase family protein [Actinobacteria bacterium]|nr:phosphotransacetylase family protein [Actinomycetota bacterium]MBU1942974.1 phosphotransacetylase family protein [Actinomycetota bacterium]MBU2687306.1 phosphotransacetylase family protein [Actinomycetota bacterium]